MHYDSHTHVDDAWHEVTSVAGESIKDLDGKLTPDAEWCMEVVDGEGHRLYWIVVATRRPAPLSAAPATKYGPAGLLDLHPLLAAQSAAGSLPNPATLKVMSGETAYAAYD